MSDPSTQSTHRSSNEAAFERVYAIHHRAVLAYCARRASPADAWDAAADVFLVAWRRPDQIPNPEAALPWLLGVARRVLANQRRSERRRRRLVLRAAASDGEAFVPVDAVVRDEDVRRLLDALGRLRPVDREIIRLSLWEELSPVEIAETLAISRAAVDQRYARAKRRLAKEMSGHQPTRTRATRITTEKGGAP